MAGNVIPYKLVDNDQDLVKVWYEYGQHATRSGFQANLANPNPIMGEVSAVACQWPDVDPSSKDFKFKCGPFRTDYWTAPLWFPVRDEDQSTLPPR
jgi:hypothetical protein